MFRASIPAIAVLSALLAGCETTQEQSMFAGYSQEQIDRCELASFKEIPQAVGTMSIDNTNYFTTGTPQMRNRLVPVDMNAGLRNRYISRCLAATGKPQITVKQSRKTAQASFSVNE